MKTVADAGFCALIIFTERSSKGKESEKATYVLVFEDKRSKFYEKLGLSAVSGD